MRCGYQCHEIGGPWIAENPDCPIHSREAVEEQEREERERQQLVERIEELESTVQRLEHRLEQLEDWKHHTVRSG